MKRITLFIRNVYRIFIVKPDGSKVAVNATVSDNTIDSEMVDDAMIKRIISEDACHIVAGEEIRKMLEQRVAGKRTGESLVRNSIFDFVMPLFSSNHIELKMVFVSLAFIFMLGLGPTSKHTVNKSLQPYILADTLIDSSGIFKATICDSALKMQD